MTMVIRSKDGTAERQVEVHEYNIPDLWHICKWIKEQEDQGHPLVSTRPMPAFVPNWPIGGEAGTINISTSQAILDCWQLCHDLIKHIQQTVVIHQVKVEVSGGVAEVTECPDGVEVEILDHDNEDCGEEGET